MDQQLQNMLMQQAIVVHQEVELTNVLIGFDKANKYSLHAPNGQKLAQSVEVGGVGGIIARQVFNNARAANVKVFGMNGIEIAEMRKRLENVIPVLSPQVRANIAISSNDAIDSSGIAAFPGRLTPVGGKARPLSSPKFGASSHLSNLLLSLRNFDPQVSIIINLRWNSVISNLLNELEINSVKLNRKGDDLSIDEGFLGAEALIDEGGYGFEPSLYIVGQDQERVCRIVEDLASSMEAMA